MQSNFVFNLTLISELLQVHCLDVKAVQFNSSAMKLYNIVLPTLDCLLWPPFGIFQPSARKRAMQYNEDDVKIQAYPGSVQRNTRRIDRLPGHSAALVKHPARSTVSFSEGVVCMMQYDNTVLHFHIHFAAVASRSCIFFCISSFCSCSSWSKSRWSSDVPHQPW